jgi:hypothetical protein
MNPVAGPVEWYKAFWREVRSIRWADPLRDAAMKGRLSSWTKHLTGVVVATCQNLGWEAVARGHLADVLPVTKQEYLAIDVMAFPRADRPGWRRPVAVFELENQLNEEIIAYSLWKVSLIRCHMSAVFCYRQNPDEIGNLLSALTIGVMGEFAGVSRFEERATLLVVGTRSRGEDFPDGFFKPYVWDAGFQQFRPLLW